MKSVVSEKGQVTIPKRLRERLGIRPGEILDFEEDAGRLVAVKMPLRDPVDAVYGVIRGRQKTDDLADLAASLDAGDRFRTYRKAGGPRARLPADFLIGAHAMLSAAS